MGDIAHVTISLGVMLFICARLIPKQWDEANNSINGLYMLRLRLLGLTGGFALICLSRAVFYALHLIDVMTTETVLGIVSWTSDIGVIMAGLAFKAWYDVSIETKQDDRKHPKQDWLTYIIVRLTSMWIKRRG